MRSLTEIKTEVDRLAAMIGPVNPQSLPTYGRSEDGARPHLEVDARGYHFVVVERGQELERLTTGDLDALLFRIFQVVTFSAALDFEVTHRNAAQDFRRLTFQRQVELLSRLAPRWGELGAEEHARILREHPFDDASGARVTLTTQLRAAGQSPAAAWEKACERYPLPVPKRA